MLQNMPGSMVGHWPGYDQMTISYRKFRLEFPRQEILIHRFDIYKMNMYMVI